MLAKLCHLRYIHSWVLHTVYRMEGHIGSGGLSTKPSLANCYKEHALFVIIIFVVYPANISYVIVA